MSIVVPRSDNTHKQTLNHGRKMIGLKSLAQAQPDRLACQAISPALLYLYTLCQTFFCVGLGHESKKHVPIQIQSSDRSC